MFLKYFGWVSVSKPFNPIKNKFLILLLHTIIFEYFNFMVDWLSRWATWVAYIQSFGRVVALGKAILYPCTSSSSAWRDYQWWFIIWWTRVLGVPFESPLKVLPFLTCPLRTMCSSSVKRQGVKILVVIKSDINMELAGGNAREISEVMAVMETSKAWFDKIMFSKHTEFQALQTHHKVAQATSDERTRIWQSQARASRSWKDEAVTSNCIRDQILVAWEQSRRQWMTVSSSTLQTEQSEEATIPCRLRSWFVGRVGRAPWQASQKSTEHLSRAFRFQIQDHRNPSSIIPASTPSLPRKTQSYPEATEYSPKRHPFHQIPSLARRFRRTLMKLTRLTTSSGRRVHNRSRQPPTSTVPHITNLKL